MRRFAASLIRAQSAGQLFADHGSSKGSLYASARRSNGCSPTASLPRCWNQAQPPSLLSLRKYAAQIDELPLVTERQRLVILGTGWAAARLAMEINTSEYDLTVRTGRFQSSPMQELLTKSRPWSWVSYPQRHSSLPGQSPNYE